jgi:hypothetical protein
MWKEGLIDCFMTSDRLCGLVVRVPGYRSRDYGFDSRRYRISWKIGGLQRCLLSLVSITEELFEWKTSGSGLENLEYNRGDPLRLPRDTLYPQKLAPTSHSSGGRSVGIVRLLTKATEFVCFVVVFADRGLSKQLKISHDNLPPGRKLKPGNPAKFSKF